MLYSELFEWFHGLLATEVYNENWHEGNPFSGDLSLYQTLCMQRYIMLNKISNWVKFHNYRVQLGVDFNLLTICVVNFSPYRLVV